MSDRWGVDPFLVVAWVDYESRWQAAAVNPSSGTVGLGQIDPRYYPGPASDLLDWRTNLRVLAGILYASRRFCLARGHVRADEWLQAPTGWDYLRGTRCGYAGSRKLPVPRGVLEVLFAARH